MCCIGSRSFIKMWAHHFSVHNFQEKWYKEKSRDRDKEREETWWRRYLFLLSSSPAPNLLITMKMWFVSPTFRPVHFKQKERAAAFSLNDVRNLRWTLELFLSLSTAFYITYRRINKVWQTERQISRFARRFPVTHIFHILTVSVFLLLFPCIARLLSTNTYRYVFTE